MTAVTADDTRATQHRSPTPTWRLFSAHARSAAGHTITSNQQQKRPHAALRSHTPATAKRGAATHTRHQKSATKSRNTAVHHPATYSTGNEHPRCASHIDGMAQPRCLIFRRPNAHITHMPTSAAPPATITPQTRARKHTQRHKPHPPQRHVTIMACVAENSAHLQATHATSHTHTQPTNTQAPHARTTSRTAPTTAHCAIIAVCTPPHARHTARHTAPTTPHAAHRKSHQSHTRPPCHTHRRAVRLLSVDGMLPESWLLFKCNFLHDTRTAIASYRDHGTRRRPATHRSAAHSINQTKSTESQSAHCMLSLKHNTVCE